MTRTIAHLSDLHFGKVDAATLDPLVEAVRDAKPDLVAVSGDLTQRARSAQFREAREFLDRLPGELIVVPGNHDVPAFGNPYQRFFSDWSRFRRYIHPDVEQTYVDGAIAVIGINTARALSFKGGRLNVRQMEAVRRCFHGAARNAVKVLVVHHPLDIPHVWPGVSAMRASAALRHWEECGVDLILAGHEHRAFAGGAERLRIGNHDAVIVQAGTATSTRVRGGELNSFNLIRTAAKEIRVERMTWDPVANRFAESHSESFARRADSVK
jgi:3',5'-cyclic AMP phosphodiesterase CpdA